MMTMMMPTMAMMRRIWFHVSTNGQETSGNCAINGPTTARNAVRFKNEVSCVRDMELAGAGMLEAMIENSSKNAVYITSSKGARNATTNDWINPVKIELFFHVDSRATSNTSPIFVSMSTNAMNPRPMLLP